MKTQISKVISPTSYFVGSVRAAGHLGIWPALYSIGALCCFVQLAGLWRMDEPWRSGLVAVGLTACGVYLLDRVKMRRGWVDPADRRSRPDRYAFLLRHETFYRLLALCALIGAAIIGWRVNIWAPLAVAIGAASVVVYAAGPKHAVPRMKDFFIVKNLYTAVGMVGFVAAAGVAAAYDANAAWASHQLAHNAAYTACGIVLARVCLDCALCDVGDESADRSAGTRTAATKLGGNWARRIALLGQIGLAALLAIASSVPIWTRLCWAGAMAGGCVASEFVPTRILGDFTDLRFALEALVAVIGIRLF